MSVATSKLGPLTVSAIGLGCMNLGRAYGMPPSAADGARLLGCALDLGCTLLVPDRRFSEAAERWIRSPQQGALTWAYAGCYHSC